MTKWTPIASSGDKDVETETEDKALNNDTLDTEEDDIELEEEEDIEITLDDLDEEEEVNEDEEDDSEPVKKPSKEESKEESKKPSRAESRIRELVARQKDLEAQLAEKDSENETLSAKARVNESDKIVAEINSYKAKLDTVKREYKAAVESGDTDALIKAQQDLTENSVSLMALERVKTQLETEKPAPRKQEATRQTKEAAPKVSHYAVEWKANNESWFDVNPELTFLALGVNQQLLKEGYDDNSPEFYEQIDARMSKYKPSGKTPRAEGNGQEAKKPKQTPPAVGSSSRTSPPKSVKASPRDLEMARRLGVNPKSYLRQKANYELNEDRGVQTFKPIMINRPNDK